VPHFHETQLNNELEGAAATVTLVQLHGHTPNKDAIKNRTQKNVLKIVYILKSISYTLIWNGSDATL